MQDSHFRTLSKSDFKAARECPTKLYYRELRYPTTKDSDPYLMMLAEGGYMVETVAKLLHQDGLHLEYGTSFELDATATMAALSTEVATVFEGTLLSGHKLARAE